MNSARTGSEKDLVALLESNSKETDGRNSREAFREIANRIMNLWARNRRNDPVWPLGFQEQVAALLRHRGNRWGFQHYLTDCEAYALRSTGDGFPDSCTLRSGIQLINDEFVPISDLVHPDDADHLEFIDDMYTQKAGDIPPIPPENIPSWAPESHWWWWAPTRHDMGQREIHAKLYDYHPEDWDTE